MCVCFFLSRMVHLEVERFGSVKSKTEYSICAETCTTFSSKCPLINTKISTLLMKTLCCCWRWCYLIRLPWKEEQNKCIPIWNVPEQVCLPPFFPFKSTTALLSVSLSLSTVLAFLRVIVQYSTWAVNDLLLHYWLPWQTITSEQFVGQNVRWHKVDQFFPASSKWRRQTAAASSSLKWIVE